MDMDLCFLEGQCDLRAVSVVTIVVLTAQTIATLVQAALEHGTLHQCHRAPAHSLRLTRTRVLIETAKKGSGVVAWVA